MADTLNKSGHLGGQKSHGTNFSARACAVFGITFSFVVMLVSGAMLFFAPRGRMAQQIDWELLGLGRHEWEGVHLAVSVLFAAFGIWHFLLHFNVFGTLLGGNRLHPGGHRKELVAALLLIVILCTAAILEWPPSSWLIDINEFFKKSYWG